jgi:hypothetical protein
MTYFQLARITERETSMYVLQYSHPLKLYWSETRDVRVDSAGWDTSSGICSVKIGRVVPDNPFWPWKNILIPTENLQKILNDKTSEN